MILSEEGFIIDKKCQDYVKYQYNPILFPRSIPVEYSQMEGIRAFFYWVPFN